MASETEIEQGLPAPDPHRWIIMLGLLLAAVMQVMDTSIVNVALAQMAGNLGTTFDEIGWVSTAYILANVAILPLTAWLSLRFGRKKYLMVSIIVFIIASMMCGASKNLGQIVLARVIQGAGGAALMSIAQATFFEIFPKKEQNTVMSLFSMGMVVAPTLAPTLGGYIVDNYTWPWAFYVNVPIGLISMFITWSYLQESIHRSEVGNADWFGIAFMIVGLGSLQYVLEEGNRYDWFNDVWITRLSIVALVTLAIFIGWQLSPKNKAPAVEFRVMKNRGFLAGNLIAAALGFGLYASLFIYPIFAQNILGFSATTTGLVLLPRGIATGIGSIICGRLLDRKIPPRTLIAVGMIIFIISMWQLSHLTNMSGEDDTRIALIICGFGLGFLFIPVTMAAMSDLKGKDISHGSALFNFTRQLGGSIGIACISTYITQMSNFHRSNLVSNINSASGVLRARDIATSGYLHMHSMSLSAARHAAYGLVDASIRIQSTVMAYNDAFLLMGIAFVVALPALFIMKKSSAKQQG